MALVRESIPVPEIIYAAPSGQDGLPPFAVRRYVEAITYRELRRRGDPAAIACAAASAGETLAAIHRKRFPTAGWLGPGPTVGAPLLDGADSMPRFVDSCLSEPNLQRRLPPEVRDSVHRAMWSRASELAALEAQSNLVHGDFNKRNTLVECIDGQWKVAAVLDWEFAVAGTPLMDFGNFLRYERSARPQAEPHFSAAYLRAGGELPEDWRSLARLVDLVAMCASLAEDTLPEAVEVDLIELVRATVEERDPLL